MKKLPDTDSANLRQKAEKLAKKKSREPAANLSEAEVQKLIFNLELHQIELELQNAELLLARDKVEAELSKFNRLYNFSPTAYFTLSKTGEIIEFNHQGSQLIGKDKNHLQKSMIGFFITDDSKPVFSGFLEKVFSSNTKEVCELTMLQKNEIPIYVHVTGICDENHETCFISMADVTSRRSQELLIQARLDLMQMAEVSSLDDLLEETLNQAEKLTGSMIGFYHFVDTDQETLWLQNWSTRTKNDYCQANGKGMHYSLDKAGVWADCVREARPLIHNDYSSLPDKKGLPQGHARLTRELTVPVIRNGKIKAIIGVGNKPTDYTGQDIDLIAQLADQAWDITELKQKKQELLESEEKWRTLFDILPVGVSILDANRNVVELNPALEQILGVSKAGLQNNEYTGRRYLDSDNNPITSDNYPSSIAIKSQEIVRNTEIGLVKENGDTIWLEVNAAPLTLPYAVCAVTTTDITSRKLANEELKSVNQRLNNIIQATNAGTWEWNVQTGETVFNETWAQLVGYTLAELAPVSIKTWEMLAHPDDLKKSYELLQDHFSSDKELYDFEGRMKHKDGHWVWIHDRGSVVSRTGDGRPLMVFGIHTDISEHREAELKIKENEKFLRETQIIAGLGTYSIDLVAGKWQGSEVLDAIFGSDPRKDKSFERWISVIHPAWQKVMADYFTQEVLGKGKPFDKEYIIIRKNDKEERWVHGLGLLEFDANGKPAKLVGTVSDITERKNAEEVLRLNKEKLQLTLAAAEIGMWTMNVKTRSGSISIHPQNVLGYDNDIIFRNEEDLIALAHPDDLNRIGNNLRDYQAGLVPVFETELRMLHKSGQYLWISGKGKIVTYDTDGSPLEIMGTIFDINEHKVAEETLKESEEKYRTVFATESDALILIDQETLAILDVNDAACRLYGYSKNEMLSMINTDLSDEPAETAKITQAFQEKIKLRYHKKSNGMVFPVEISASLFMLKNRQVILAAIRDISQRVLADSELAYKNYELQKINAEKDKFFSIISHDLRGPFNSFLGLTQIMAEKLPTLTMDEIQQIANSMRTSATNLYRLLENLLQWSRMKQGLIPFTPKRVNLRSIVDESLKMVLDTALSKGIEIQYDIPDEMMVLADSNMLLAVMRNLVSNAVKFTGKGGRISLSAKAGDDKNVEISIEDTGIGMDKHLIKNLFVLDVNTSRKGTEGESSTGLGLILCKDFIEKQGGTLKVESETGKGSIFRFTIPHPNKPKGKQDIKNIFEPPVFENQVKSLKILIAEDDETSEILVSIAIRMFSREVIKVKNGIEAVNACRNHPDIDLVIMDIKMPEMDGYEATRQIRKFNKDVVIISQTAYGQPGDRHESIAAGCNDYISKPLDLALFKEMIKKQFKK